MNRKPAKSMIIFVVLASFLFASTVMAAKEVREAKADQILIKNVKIFNGVDNKLTPGNVLVEGSLIKSIGKNVNAGPEATVIDGGGRTLLPGLIDGHAHVMINAHFDVVEKDSDLTDLSSTSFKAPYTKERLQFLNHFYEYCKNNTDNFKESWSEYCARTQFVTAES